MMNELYSRDAEFAVIGGLLMRNDAFDDVAQIVEPGSFFSEAHRFIYAAIEHLISNHKPADVITVCQRLQETGKLESVGGQPYVATIAVESSGANLKNYAQIVAEKALQRKMMAAVQDAHNIIAEPGETLAKLAAVQERVLSVAPIQRGAGLVPVSEALVPVVSNIRDRMLNGKIPGLPTGFTDLDHKLGGLQAGDLIVIAGRPSMGKTALALQIAEHVADAGEPAAVFSLEMSKEQLLTRALAGRAHIDATKLRDGEVLNEEESARFLQAVQKLDRSNLHIDDSAGLRAVEVGARLRALRRKHGVKLAVVDYLQLMPGDGDNRVQEMGSITRALKNLAKELPIPIILISQLSRKCEERMDKRPILSDLRDSGEIEQDADVVIMLYRDEYYYPESTAAGTAEALIRKQRNGPVGMARLCFLSMFGAHFENYAGPELFARAPAKKTRSRHFEASHSE